MSLIDFFKENNKVALCFSGGVDSAYLLYMAKKCGADIKAYYVKTQFQPNFELEDAKRLATELNVKMSVIDIDILCRNEILINSPNRCYYCKKMMFQAIKDRAIKEGYNTIIDGTNASDNLNDRAGVRAIKELNVCSPLYDCGITKDEIRQLSKQAKLFTYNKPAYACLATRIYTGDIITNDKLKLIEKAENYLTSIGFSDFRVRLFNKTARLEINNSQFPKAIEMKNDIVNNLSPLFDGVLLDLIGR